MTDRDDPRLEPNTGPFDTDAPWMQQRALDAEGLLSGVFWAEIRTFLAVAKFGSMNRAAEYLGVRQEKVSAQIRRLQSVIGCQLVVQSRSGTRLTDRGSELAGLAVRFDRDLSAIATDLKAETALAEGSVRLTITDGLGMVFLAPALRAFAAQYPRIQVQIKTPTNFRDLTENQTDLMLGFSEDLRHDVTCRRLGNLHLLPVASHGYIESYGLPGPDNLDGHSFVDSDQYSSRGGAYDGWHRLTRRGRVTYRADVSLTYAMLVKCGLGIGLLANYTMIEKTFVPLELGLHIPLRLYGMALTERLRSRPVSIVFDFLCSLFSTRTTWFAEKMHLDPNVMVDDSGPSYFDLRSHHLPAD